MPLPPAVFLHVPKAAGNYLRRFLWYNVPKEVARDRRCIVREEMDRVVFDTMAAAEIDRFHLITGHFGHDRLQGLPPRLRIVFLRDPAERILSLYRYWRTAPFDSLLFNLARQYSLRDLIDGKAQIPTGQRQWLDYYLDNAMTWQLADRFERRELSALSGAPEASVLAAATENLQTFRIGFAEDADGAIDALAAEFGLARPQGSWSRNESPKMTLELDASGVRALMGPRLALDDALYAAAQAQAARQRTTTTG